MRKIAHSPAAKNKNPRAFTISGLSIAPRTGFQRYVHGDLQRASIQIRGAEQKVERDNNGFFAHPGAADIAEALLVMDRRKVHRFTLPG